MSILQAGAMFCESLKIDDADGHATLEGVVCTIRVSVPPDNTTVKTLQLKAYTACFAFSRQDTTDIDSLISVDAVVTVLFGAQEIGKEPLTLVIDAGEAAGFSAFNINPLQFDVTPPGIQTSINLEVIVTAAGGAHQEFARAKLPIVIDRRYPDFDKEFAQIKKGK